MRLTARDRVLLLAPFGLLLSGGLLLPALLGLASTRPRDYAAVLADPAFGAAARNVSLFTLVAVPLELTIGFALACLLRRAPGWRTVLLAPWLVSPIAGGVMWHFLFGRLDRSPIGDVHLALPALIGVEVWRTAPFASFLLLPGLLAIPAERWEDARLNGASWLRTVLVVALPAMRPLLLAVAMLLTGLALGTFDAVLILTGGGPGTATVTPALYSYHQAFGANDWPTATAAAWLIAGAVLAAGAAYLGVARSRPHS